MSKIVIPKNAVYEGVNDSGEIVYSVNKIIDSSTDGRIDMEMHLIHATKQYPKGTKVKDGEGRIGQTTDSPYIDGSEIKSEVGESSIGPLVIVLYKDGKWIEKVEPKFKIGDFVVANSSNEYLITKSGSGMYCIAEDVASNKDDFNLSTKENFESALAKVGFKFDYEKLTAEPIDEFAHLPQTLPNEEWIMWNCPLRYNKAFNVQSGLLLLYEAWKDELDWTNNQEPKYVIDLSANNLSMDRLSTSNCLFAFATRKKAERFVELFRPLLEEYKPLMG